MMLKPTKPALINVSDSVRAKVALALDALHEVAFFKATERGGLTGTHMPRSVATITVDGQRLYVVMYIPYAFGPWQVTVMTESQAKNKLTATRESGKLVGYDGATKTLQNSVVRQAFAGLVQRAGCGWGDPHPGMSIYFPTRAFSRLLFLGAEIFCSLTADSRLKRKTMMAKTTKKAVAPIYLSEIRGKDFKRFGQTIAGSCNKGHQAVIKPGESIELFGEADRWIDGKTVKVAYTRTFRIGDVAEYDSYNMSYMGTITSITEKTITIVDPHNKQVHRLSIYQFDWRNWDLDVEKECAKNSEAMQYLLPTELPRQAWQQRALLGHKGR